MLIICFTIIISVIESQIAEVLYLLHVLKALLALLYR